MPLTSSKHRRLILNFKCVKLNNFKTYNTEQIETERKVRYLFESVGSKPIIKIIEYTPLGVMEGRTIYNLGFGDYHEDSGGIVDDVNSNNGDMYIVFNTILSTVPLFFKANPESVILVSGNDSHEQFIANCLPICKKKCLDTCKNFERRIRTYRYYIDKNFDELSKEFIFFGRNKTLENTFVQYVPSHVYNDILVYKKK